MENHCRGLLLVCCLLLLNISFTNAQTEPESLRVIQHNAFTVGEKLVFDVKYSFITAGEAVFLVDSIIRFGDRDCYRIVATVQSTPTFSWFYKVDDLYETIIDYQGMFPWRFTQRLREGSYKNDFEAWFDQINHIAYTEKGNYRTPNYVYDAVSAFFYVRTLDFSHFKPGEKIYLNNFYKDSTYLLAVKFLGFERVSVSAGTFDTFIVEPLVKEGGLFKNEGRILIWLTNDEKKIPVKVNTKIVVGSIDAELREYHGVQEPISAKIK